MGIYIYGIRGSSKAWSVVINGEHYLAATANFQANVGMMCSRELPRGLEARWAKTEKSWRDSCKPDFVISCSEDGKPRVGDEVYRMRNFQVKWYDTPDFGGMKQVGVISEIHPRDRVATVTWQQFDVRWFSERDGKPWSEHHTLYYAQTEEEALGRHADCMKNLIMPKPAKDKDGFVAFVFSVGAGPNYDQVLELFSDEEKAREAEDARPYGPGEGPGVRTLAGALDRLGGNR